MSSEQHGSLFADMGPNAGYVEDLYNLYKIDPKLVPSDWQEYFSSLSNGDSAITVFKRPTNGHAALSLPAPQGAIDERVFRLIDAYRSRGHLYAKVNPLQSVTSTPSVPELEPEFYGLKGSDFEREFEFKGELGLRRANLQDLISKLKAAYCGSIGFEYSHLDSPEERSWLMERIEARGSGQNALSAEEKRRALKSLMEAEIFEAQLHKKYVGQKRFSLEGSETFIPMLSTLVDNCSRQGVDEFVVGMAHRGRLALLSVILQKPLKELLSEFEDQSIYSILGSGDVKYHLGHSGRIPDSSGNEIRGSLVPNPSHLEAVNPVVEGIVRARQDLKFGSDRVKVLPVLVHGDAAVIGQGVVAETLNLQDAPGFETGGTIHIVINNQVGFTTNPEEGRSTIYCTDVIKTFRTPVFHINCEDPEAACWAMKVALEFRSQFGRDVALDLIGYRKYGHNEADDPSFTQPKMYAEIDEKEKISVIFRRSLIQEGLISDDDCRVIEDEYLNYFDQVYQDKDSRKAASSCSTLGRLVVPSPDTGVDEETLVEVASALVKHPDHFTVHPKLSKIIEKRSELISEGGRIDWAYAEALAFGSLLLDGVGIRLTGQDVGRGTFSHRHLMLSDYKTGERFLPLNQLTESDPDGVRYEAYNSPLSEYGVLGFEFGYSAEATRKLVLWEAQFGDFANGAQIILDQFISSSEAKWEQRSGVVLLLPHGYEGQGPEHSSARLERYLQLCAQGNMVVCNPSSAAQYFHLLRRQGVLEFKRPLIVMTPKSLLRNPEATCGIEELTFGSFHTVLEDSAVEPEGVETLVLAAGKFNYEIRQALSDRGEGDVQLLRIEQLYPLPSDELKRMFKKYKRAKRFIWAQEEPKNMGGYAFMRNALADEFEIDLRYAGRPATASTASGSYRRSAAEQQAILVDLAQFLDDG